MTILPNFVPTSLRECLIWHLFRRVRCPSGASSPPRSSCQTQDIRQPPVILPPVFMTRIGVWLRQSHTMSVSKNRLLAINKGLWHLRLLGMVLAIPINLSDPISTGLPARPYFESARYWSPGRRSSRYSFVREVLNQRKDCGFGRVEVCSDSSG